MAESFTKYSSDCDKDGNLVKSFTLDKKSTEFLEEHLGSKINPEIKTITDYCRTVFYFKCCGIQEETNKNTASEHDFSINNCFFSKEKADILFENVYAHAKESDEFIQNMNKSMEAGIMPSDEDVEKLMKYQETGQVSRLMIMNDSLYSELEHKENNTMDAFNEQKEQTALQHVYDITMSDIELPPELEREDLLRSDAASFYENAQKNTISGNKGILRTGNLSQFSGYLNAFPDLAQKMNENYSAVVTQAAADIAPSLPKDANLDEYLPVIKEHPKAVLALAITAKANKEINLPTTIDSPEDLLKKSQYPAIIALSDKISFNDLQGSMKTTYKEAQAVIGLGRENTDIPTISRAKVNEG